MSIEKAILIYSGGMDSFTLLNQLVHDFDIHALSFDYGQKHSKELHFAKYVCHKLSIPHTCVDISSIGELIQEGSALTDKNREIPEGHYEDENMKQTVVPNRNMIMLSIAVARAVAIGATSVWCAVHAGDHAIYPDCRPDFIKAMNDAVDIGNYAEIRIDAPYMHKSKGEIVAIGKAMGLDYSLSWTCYKGEDFPCGKCGACVERAEAFAFAGIVDPLVA